MLRFPVLAVRCSEASPHCKYCALPWGAIILCMADDDSGENKLATKDDLREIRAELKAESEKLKALEIRVGVIEQNLLGN